MGVATGNQRERLEEENDVVVQYSEVGDSV